MLRLVGPEDKTGTGRKQREVRWRHTELGLKCKTGGIRAPILKAGRQGRVWKGFRQGVP